MDDPDLFDPDNRRAAGQIPQCTVIVGAAGFTDHFLHFACATSLLF